MDNDNGPNLFGTDLFGQPIRQGAYGGGGIVAERFMVPPFTVLNAREGWWQERKRAWCRLGIRSEEGREQGLAYNMGDWVSPDGRAKATDQIDTSIFDPVLCELAFRWFSPPSGVIVDPFAGGSVRGIVAVSLGRTYHGIELRPEQVEANVAQGAVITPDRAPTWVCGDALEELPRAPLADMIFTCPPYGNLEVYSDDPRDISNMDAAGFDRAYREIIRRAVDRLRPDRFAAFVVGDYRLRDGTMADFVGTTIDAFRDAGMRLYNQAVLVTAVGSLALRITKQFVVSRKMGKAHQDVLVFVKGDPRVATRACAMMPDDMETLG